MFIVSGVLFICGCGFPPLHSLGISLLITTFVILIMLRFFEVYDIFCILRHLNDNSAYPPTKARFLEDWGLDGINVPFSICHVPGGAVYPHSPLLSTPGALTLTPKVPMGPQTCWKSCATLACKSWALVFALKFRPLRGRSCAAPAGPIWGKQTSHGASSCKLRCDVWPVCWDAVFFFFEC